MSDPTLNQREVSRELRSLRLKANLLAKQVGGEMGLTCGYLCDLEHGRRSWTSELVNRYRSALESLTATGRRGILH